MTPGVVYDFNNSWNHGVRNDDDRARINLMLEYLPNPEWVHPMPIVFDEKRQATLKTSFDFDFVEGRRIFKTAETNHLDVVGPKGVELRL